jgi:hypothetical protein
MGLCSLLFASFFVSLHIMRKWINVTETNAWKSELTIWSTYLLSTCHKFCAPLLQLISNTQQDHRLLFCIFFLRVEDLSGWNGRDRMLLLHWVLTQNIQSDDVFGLVKCSSHSFHEQLQHVHTTTLCGLTALFSAYWGIKRSLNWCQ